MLSPAGCAARFVVARQARARATASTICASTTRQGHSNDLPSPSIQAISHSRHRCSRGPRAPPSQRPIIRKSTAFCCMLASATPLARDYSGNSIAGLAPAPSQICAAICCMLDSASATSRRGGSWGRHSSAAFCCMVGNGCYPPPFRCGILLHGCFCVRVRRRLCTKILLQTAACLLLVLLPLQGRG